MAHPRNQVGASLVIVLGVVGFLTVMVVSMLKLASVGAVVTGVDSNERQQTYAVASALDAAIQEARRAQWMGRYGAVCSTLTVPVGTTTVSVSCTSSTRMTDLNRTIRFQARVDGQVRGVADVVICDAGGVAATGNICAAGGGTEPAVQVFSWNVRGT
ncbi:MAG: hypothetical protein ACKO04_03255 [Actinomycetes bacterium]